MLPHSPRSLKRAVAPVIIGILALIIGFIVTTWRSDRVSSWLFVPYALWVAFASTLNLAIAVLN